MHAAAPLQAARLPTTALAPHADSLFVAWHGVIALVYDGFPPPLVRAKQLLRTLPRLRAEQFGSMWPKSTLAALVDGSPPLTVDQLAHLRRICAGHSAAIAALAPRITVRLLSVVEYEQRGLEKLLRRVDVPLIEEASADSDRPEDEERARVARVVAEWDDLEAYLPKVNAPGSRIRSYREESPRGVTCVCFLHPLPEPLRRQLANFREEVDAAFPQRYAWLDEASLHCTLRSLADD